MKVHQAGWLALVPLLTAVCGGGPEYPTASWGSTKGDTRPALTAGDVRNAADYSSGGITPGEAVVFFPSNAGPLDIVPAGLAGNLNETIAIGDTRVLFDDVAVPIYYTVRGQICTFVPDSVASQETTTVVVEYQGRRSSPVTLNVVLSTPAIFSLDATGKGQAAMLNETGCCNSVRNPAVKGSSVSLFATGEGKLEPADIEEEVSVTVGGVPAAITFTKNAGVFQVNFRVPVNAPVGDAIPLVLTVRGERSSAGVTMALRSPADRVLLVHRDAGNAASLGSALKKSGYQLVVAKGLDEVGSHAEQLQDLLILDVDSPVEQASEMLAKLKATNPLMRTIVIAGDLGPQTLKQADLLGAQAVLSRPLDSDKAVATVRRLLRRRTAVY